MRTFRNILIPLLLLATAAHSEQYYAVGIKARSEEAAHNNSVIVATSKVSIHFSADEFFFEIPIHWNTNGCNLTGEGQSTTELAESQQFGDDNPLYTPATRFVAVNSESGENFLVLSGMGQSVEYIAFYGRRWPTFQPYPSGPRAKSCIAIEGRSQPPTGRHAIKRCGFFEADYGIRCLATPEETHADLGFVENCYGQNIGSFFRCENAQSVSWQFDHVFLQQDGPPSIFFDIVRGGKLSAHGVYYNGRNCTLLKVRDDLAPNCNRYEITDFQWDHTDGADSYLNPLDTTVQSLTGSITGHANNPQFGFQRRYGGVLLNPRLKFDVVGAK